MQICIKVIRVFMFRRLDDLNFSDYMRNEREVMCFIIKKW